MHYLIKPAQQASMRPRPEGRGERWSVLGVARPDCVLQCGHDPKAVENVEWRREHDAAKAMLQCGHDPKAVENCY